MTYPRPRSLKRWQIGTPAWKRRLHANLRMADSPYYREERRKSPRYIDPRYGRMLDIAEAVELGAAL